ncbi:MAG: type II secretion system F family protein [Polyangiaceae bacterium]
MTQKLQLSAIATLGLAFALLTFALACAPSKPAGRLGLRGLKRQRALAQRGMWSAVEPMVRWLGVRLSGMVSPPLRQTLDLELSAAGDVLGLTADELLALSGLSSVAGGLAAVALAGFTGIGVHLLLLVCVSLGALLPYLQITSMRRERLLLISRGLPFVVDLMAMAMSAGLDFPGAVRQVVDKAPNPRDPIVEELSLLLQGIQVGRSRREVLEELARRARCEAVLEFTGAVIQAEARGNPLAEVLQVQAVTFRSRRTLSAEEAASKASVKMTGPLFLVFVSVLLLVIAPMVIKVTAMQ